MRARLVVASVIAVVALAGCSNDSNPPAPGGGGATSVGTGGDGGSSATISDPCGVVTQAAAEAAFGSPLGAGQATTEANGSACVYPASVGSVTILVYQEPDWDTVHSSYQSIYGTNFHDIDGLGDAAFTNGIDAFVKVGGTVVKFSIIGPFPDRGQRAVTLAQTTDL